VTITPTEELPPAGDATNDAATEEARLASSRLFGSLRYRNLRLLWIGQTGHAAALWMEQVARPWLVLDLTNDNAAHVGGVVSMRVIPQLLFGVWAGVIADRIDRKLLLFSTKAGVFILNVVFALLLVMGWIELWHVYVVSFIRGIFMSFDQPARQSLIADSVPPLLLTNAVALMSSTQNVMRIFGVMASGLLIAVLGITGTFVTIAAVYFVTVVATYLIDVPARTRQRSGGVSSLGTDLWEGVRYAASQPAIRGVLLLSLVFYATAIMWMQLFAPLFARTVMDIGSVGFSSLVAVGGAGSLLATLYIAARRPDRPGWLVSSSTTLLGVALMAFALTPSAPGNIGLFLPFAAIFFVGVFHGGFMPLTQTILLTATPEHLRGRIISLVSLDRAMTTLGALIGGFMSEWIGIQTAQFIYGVVTLAAGFAIFIFARGLRSYRIPR
jgi:MFS family permease